MVCLVNIRPKRFSENSLPYSLGWGYFDTNWSTPALGGILRENWERMVDRDKRLKSVFKKPPMVVNKRGKNLRNILTRAKMPKERGGMRTRSDMENGKGFKKCNKGLGRAECRMCAFAVDRNNEVVKKVEMSNLGQDIKITQSLNCRSKGVVYIAKDLEDGKLYCGQTGRETRHRFLDHYYSISNRDEKTPLGKHFTEKVHPVTSLRMIPVMQVRGSSHVRKIFERRIINDYDLCRRGLNRIL